MSLKKGFSLSLLLLVTGFMVSGCSSSPRGLAHKSSRPVANVELKKQSQAEALFASEVASMTAGETRFYAVSPLGDNVTVTARPFYTSALGDQCRKGSSVIGDNNVLFTVCRKQDGSWYYVAPLFDSVED